MLRVAMNVVYFLLPIVIALACLGVWAFFKALKSGQFDDLETPAVRMLFDEDQDGQQD
jgi:cbb3-type cytochrome oxidase maturation protein